MSREDIYHDLDGPQVELVYERCVNVRLIHYFRRVEDLLGADLPYQARAVVWDVLAMYDSPDRKDDHAHEQVR